MATIQAQTTEQQAPQPTGQLGHPSPLLERIMAAGIGLAERDLLPDRLVRAGIRRLLAGRISDLGLGECEAEQARKQAFVAHMDEGPIALLPNRANEQHYEVRSEFFAQVLGPARKYSCCLWDEGVASLAQAEARAIEVTSTRAGLGDGMRVLELGCGWGSVSLWAAERFPGSAFTAVSNSRSQRAFIESEAAARGLSNLRVITADMNDFAAEDRFDRVFSVEMFEHIRNHRRLFERIHNWLEPGGRFFMHVFCHRQMPYFFEDQDGTDWMSRHFFSGGMMPSDDLPLYFQDHLRLVDRWRWSGTHYERTLNAWLENMDRRRQQVWSELEETYGVDQARLWWGRWRIFFMACAELFGYDKGQQWWVGHYLFERPA
jgi:cyclopropane-fatty-acyl-phospholipid synthase